MTLYLHIGIGKTGSTSVQVFLEANAVRLRQQGYVVPTSAGRRNHRYLAMYAFDDDVVDNLRRAKGHTTPQRIARFRESFRAAFLAEAAGWAPHETILCSSEQMSRLRSVTALQRLKDLVDETGRPVKVIVYFRRQDGMIVSEYSQFIKGGKVTTLEEEIHLARTRRAYNYYRTASLWAQVFGRENVIVRVFEKSQMKNGDTVDDYLSVVGIQDTLPYEKIGEANRSLDIHVMEYLRQLNKHVPRWAEKGSNPARAGLALALEEISTGPKLRLGPAEAAAFMRSFAASNARLAREFLGREDGRLFSEDFGTGAERSEEPLTIDKAIEISAMLWHKLKENESRPVKESAEAD